MLDDIDIPEVGLLQYCLCSLRFVHGATCVMCDVMYQNVCDKVLHL